MKKPYFFGFLSIIVLRNEDVKKRIEKSTNFEHSTEAETL